MDEANSSIHEPKDAAVRDSVKGPLALGLRLDEARALKNPEVVGGRWLGHPESEGDFANAELAGGQQPQDDESIRIGKGRKDLARGR